MITHPFLLGCTLLFWGWQSQLLFLALPMALILEGARWINWRWVLVDKDFHRVTDFTSLSLVIVAIYLLSQDSIYGLMTLLKWLPMIFFLLLTAQIYSTQGSIKLSSLLLSLRHYETKGTIAPSSRVDISYPYLVMCLLSASVNHAPWFFEGMCLLATWGLWVMRPRHHHMVIWGILWLLVLVFAYLGQHGFRLLQYGVEELILSWYQQQWQDQDPYRQNTAIGDIGQLKQSDRIMLRVKAPYPLRLREASYNLYYKTNWHAKPAQFSAVTHLIDNSSQWTFTNSVKPVSPLTVQVSSYLQKGKGVLALPHGTYQVNNLIVPIMQRNPLGTVKIAQGPGLVRYSAYLGRNTPLDSLPNRYDQHLPENEQEHLMNLSKQLGLSQQSPTAVLHTLAQFFSQNFQYSLQLTTSTQNDLTPLAYFLHHSRTGHCEYFATATVLLLRTAGIPSRYASGYVVEEFSELEQVYIVRQRHAHAWALAYVEGRWVELDTTPAGWVQLEDEMAAWWEPIYDLGSWFAYQFAKWRWGESETHSDWLIWLIPPLSLLLVWRLYSRKKVAHSQQHALALNNLPLVPGADSPFYQIIQRLNTAGYVRLPGETITAWLERIQIPQSSLVDLSTLLFLHQRYRFDPAGINSRDKELLIKQVETWLRNFN